MTLHRTLASMLALAVCFATLGCVVTEPRTEVLIDIDAESGIRDDAVELITTVRGGVMHSAYTSEYTERRPDPSFPLTLSVAPIDQDSRRVVEVAVLARSTDGAIIGRYQLRTRYVAGQSTRITILLTDCCRGVARTCVAGESCVDCECEVLEEELPDAGPVDAGVAEDAPTSPDSSLPSCRTDVDCPTVNCEVGVCTDSRCVYTPTCAAGEMCCGNQCAANCDCMRIPVGRTCREVAMNEVCDVPEVCTGTSPACPPDLVDPALTLCRGAVGECDVAESCDGVNKACPGDGFALGTMCSMGVCNAGGVCGACIPDGPCRYAADQSPCDLGRRNCMTGVCSPGMPAPSSTLCRVSGGVCDLPEYCTGSSTVCPTNVFAPASRVCGPSSGPCDVEERCAGGPTCPPDLRQSAGLVCSRGRNLCDLDAVCNGTDSACPPAGFASAGTTCRPAVSDVAGATCDVAEQCTGTSGSCPPDVLIASRTLCRPSGSTACDTPEFCNGMDAACPPNEFISGRCVESGQCGECRGGVCQTASCAVGELCCVATMMCQPDDGTRCGSRS